MVSVCVHMLNLLYIYIYVYMQWKQLKRAHRVSLQTGSPAYEK